MMDKTKKMALAGLITSSIVAPALAEESGDKIGDAFDPQNWKLSIDASTAFASKYVSGSGFIIGKGPVNQTYVGVNIGEHLTLGAWTNYDFGNEALHEIDGILRLHSDLFSIKEGPFKGKVSGRIGLDIWAYPSGLEGSQPDYAIRTGVHYHGPVDLDIGLTKIITHGLTLDQNRVELALSKSYELFKIGNANVYLIPSVSTAFHDNFYGERGFGHITPKVALGVSRGPWSFEVFAAQQFGISHTMKDELYFGVSLSVNDLSKGVKSLEKMFKGR